MFLETVQDDNTHKSLTWCVRQGLPCLDLFIPFAALTHAQHQPVPGVTPVDVLYPAETCASTASFSPAGGEFLEQSSTSHGLV